MKKIIILVLLASIHVLGANAQCTLPYKPLSDFGKDTTAYIVYNFMGRAECYKGKTLKEVVTDLKIPVKYFTHGFSSATGFHNIYIYIYSIDHANSLRRQNMINNSIYIEWEDASGISTTDLFKMNKQKWGDFTYNLLKELKIKRVKVDIPENSVYYEKYKNQTKSSERSKSTGGRREIRITQFMF